MTHKFGLKLPHSVQEALQIDEEMGTNFWRRAIEKEMKKVMPASEKWDNGHLEAVYHIFAYLRKHECSRIVFDEAMIDVDE
jgi:hypothetical protein